MSYDAVVVHNGGEVVRITIHDRSCAGSIGEVVRAVVHHSGAGVYALDATDHKAVVGECLSWWGVGKVEWHECVEGKRVVIDPVLDAHVICVGAVVAEADGQRVIVCGECGAVNPRSRAACQGCGSGLWTDTRTRIAASNRKLTTAIKDKDVVEQKRLRHEIGMIIQGAEHGEEYRQAGDGKAVVVGGARDQREMRKLEEKSAVVPESKKVIPKVKTGAAIPEPKTEVVIPEYHHCPCCMSRIPDSETFAKGHVIQVMKVFGEVSRGEYEASELNTEMRAIYRRWSRKVGSVVEAARYVDKHRG